MKGIKVATRRTPYQHNDTPPSASVESVDENKLWLDAVNQQPEDEPLEIKLDDDTSLATGGTPPPKEDPVPEVVAQPDPEPVVESAKPSADDEAFRRLKAQLDREKAARDLDRERLRQLESDRTSARESLRQEQERAQAYQKEHLEAQEIAIDNAISFAESQAVQAQREITRALSEGDYDAVGTAHRALAKAESDLSRLKEGKTAIEAQKKQPVQRQDPPAPEQQSPQTQYDRIEAYITQPAHSLRAQQYMRDHYDDLFRDFDSGAKRLSKLVAGHWGSKAEGLIEGSDAYFDYLDGHMGYKEPVETPPSIASQPPAAIPPKQKQVPPAAPVSRGQNGNGSHSSSSVTLTPAQVAFCRESGLDPKIYAKELIRLKNAPNDPNYSGPRFTNDLN
jgi:hypothetical protein